LGERAGFSGEGINPLGRILKLVGLSIYYSFNLEACCFELARHLLALE